MTDRPHELELAIDRIDRTLFGLALVEVKSGGMRAALAASERELFELELAARYRLHRASAIEFHNFVKPGMVIVL